MAVRKGNQMKKREREQRYVLPLYRDANYLACIDAVLARVSSAKGE